MKRRLQRLLDDGQLRRHRTSRQEVADLLAVAARDLTDARVEAVSFDRRFATAHSAALQLATVVLAASGFRAAAQRGHHALTIRALPELLGPDTEEFAAYLDSCRSLRNTSDYDRAGAVTEQDVRELLEEAEHFREQVLAWLSAQHPALVPPSPRVASHSPSRAPSENTPTPHMPQSPATPQS